MSRTKSYINGIFSTTGQKVLTKIIGLIITPIVLSYLGQDTYGIWLVIGSFLGYMGLMDFGITGSVTQLIAKSDTTDNAHRINIIVNNSFFLQVIIGAFIILIGVVSSFFFPTWFNIQPESQEIAWMAFLLAAIGYGISFPPKTLKGLVRGKQYISLLVWVEFSLFISNTALNLWFLHLGMNLLALPVSTIIIRILSYAVYFKVAQKAYPHIHLSVSYFKWSEAKSILSVSSVWFIGAMSALVIYTSDTIIIGAVLGTGVVTVYALSFRLSEFLREFIYTISNTAMPGLGQLVGQGEYKKVKHIFLKMYPFIINTTMAAVVLVALFNEHFVSLWVGAELYGGQKLSNIFALTLFTTVIFHSFSVILSSGLNLKVIAISRSIEAALNIGFSLWLVDEFGLIGVAMGTIIANVLTSFWAVPYYASRYIGLSIGDILKNFAINVGFSSLLYIMLYLFLRDYMFNTYGNFPSFFVLVVTSLIFIWFFGLTQDLREKVIAKIRQRS